MSIVNARMIFYLSGVVETFPDDAINNDPRQQEKAEEVGLNFSDFLDSATDMQDFIAAKIKLNL